MLHLKEDKNHFYLEIIKRHSKNLFQFLDDEIEMYINSCDKAIRNDMFDCHKLIQEAKLEINPQVISSSTIDEEIKEIIRHLFLINQSHVKRENYNSDYYKDCLTIWIDLIKNHKKYDAILNLNTFSLLEEYWNGNLFYLLCYNYTDNNHTFIPKEFEIEIVNQFSFLSYSCIELTKRFLNEKLNRFGILGQCSNDLKDLNSMFNPITLLLHLDKETVKYPNGTVQFQFKNFLKSAYPTNYFLVLFDEIHQYKFHKKNHWIKDTITPLDYNNYILNITNSNFISKDFKFRLFDIRDWLLKIYHGLIDNCIIQNSNRNNKNIYKTINMNKSKQILLFSANPKITDYNAMLEETKKIKHTIRSAKYRDDLVFKPEHKVTFDDLQQELLEQINDDNINIIHFSTHGDDRKKQYGIILQGKEDNSNSLTIEGLRDLLASRALKDKIQCVILNACYSYEQAKILNAFIPYVIGMSNMVSEEAAIEFSKGFYLALGTRQDFYSSWEQGCIKIRGKLDREYGIPILFENGKIHKFSDNDYFATVGLTKREIEILAQETNVHVQLETAQVRSVIAELIVAVIVSIPDPVVTGITSGVIGAFLGHFFAKRREKQTNANTFNNEVCFMVRAKDYPNVYEIVILSKDASKATEQVNQAVKRFSQYKKVEIISLETRGLNNKGIDNGKKKDSKVNSSTTKQEILENQKDIVEKKIAFYEEKKLIGGLSLNQEFAAKEELENLKVQLEEINIKLGLI